jgi:hypothetical protein
MGKIKYLKEQKKRAWTGLIWLRIGASGGLFEHGNGLPCSTKCGDFIDWLRKC